MRVLRLRRRTARRLMVGVVTLMAAALSFNPPMATAATQDQPVNWGLDRIDQHSVFGDAAYSYDDSAGAGVHVYVVDTGVNIFNPDFGARASWGIGANFGGGDPDASLDCDGHGTLVAGVAGSTTYGVAKKAQIVAVRVYGCDTAASDALALPRGLQWVIDDVKAHRTPTSPWPAVVNMSIGGICHTEAGQITDCRSTPQVVSALHAVVDNGIPLVLAGGNENLDACRSPFSGIEGSIMVGALRSDDTRLPVSNFGPCIDIWAPGDHINTLNIDDPHGSLSASGTSMAAPFVTGAVALLLGMPQFARATPAQLSAELKRTATRVTTDLGPGSPNLVLFTRAGLLSNGSPIALTRNADGRLELFGANRTGSLFHRSQTAGGSDTWQPWQQSTSGGWFAAAAAPLDNRRVEVAALTQSGQVWQRQQAAVNANSWTAWSQLTGLLTSVAMAPNRDGRLEMAGVNADGQAFRRAQTAPNASTWGPWVPFPFSGRLRTITAATDSTGHVQMYAIDDGHQIWQTSQPTPDVDTWFPFTAFTPPGGAKDMNEIALCRNADGRLELVGTDGAGVWRTAQFQGAFTAWTSIDSDAVVAHLAAAADSNGRVEIVGVDLDGHLWQSRQSTPGDDTYTAWSQIDGLLRP